LILGVGLESDLRPGQPAEPEAIFPNQVRLIAIGGLDQRTFGWSICLNYPVSNHFALPYRESDASAVLESSALRGAAVGFQQPKTLP